MVLNVLKKTLLGLAFAAAALVSLPHAHAEKLPTLPSAWLNEHETFVAWYAKQQGWDKEEGFNLAMMPFDSGKNLVENLAATNWAVAGCGAVPALTTSLSGYLYIIAVGNDESSANALYVRKNSPILATKGHNPSYPEVYGSASTVKGATILCPPGTSAHYLLGKWLQTLGLSAKDVTIKSVEPTPGLSAFTGGEGDIVALWAPLTYEAEKAGFVSIATSKALDQKQPVLLVANKLFADQNPAMVQAFLRMYLRAVDTLCTVPASKMAEEYMRFHQEWTGKPITKEAAIHDILVHPVYPLGEQIDIFAPNGALQHALDEVLDFTIQQGSYTPEQIDRMKKAGEVNSSFLKALEQ